MSKTRLISALILVVSLTLIIGGFALIFFTSALEDGVLATHAVLTDAPQAGSRAGAVQVMNPPPTLVLSPEATHEEWPAQSAPARVDAPQAAVPQQVVITFDAQASASERTAYIASIGGMVSQEVAALDMVVVQVPQAAARAPLPVSNVVVASEPNYYVVAQHGEIMGTTPDDPRLGDQWALPLIGALESWHHLPLAMPMIKVAVVDSGICDHPELSGRVLPGYDFVEEDTTPQDTFGHGCAVAGILAARINDGMGMAGVAPNVQIIPLRVLNSAGVGTYADVAAAIVYAVDSGAEIINVSLGGASESAVLRGAVDYAAQQGVMVIAAAGNNGSANVLYPAAYDNVIAVGAIDPNLQRSGFSNYGAGVDLWSPGRDILATDLNGGYRLMSGTSFAAPYVTGVAALEKALGSSLMVNGGIVAVGGVPLVNITATPPASTTPGLPTFTPTEASMTANALFVETQAQAALAMETRLGVMRSRYAGINFGAISQTGAAQVSPQSAIDAPLLLNLFDDVLLTAEFDTVEAHELTANGFIWKGHVISDDPGTSEVVLVVGEGQMTGYVRRYGELYHIAYAGNGVYAINQISEDTFMRRHVNPLIPELDDSEMTSVSLPQEASASAFTQIDLMVVYTTNARVLLGGTAAAQNAIQLAVAASNQAYINSQVNMRLRLVHVAEVGYNENTGSGQGEDLEDLQAGVGGLGVVHSWRNTYGADVITLITNNSASYCGVGYQMEGAGQPSNSFSNWAFNAVIVDCLPGGRTLAHEIGHNMGAAHDFANQPSGGLRSDSYGYIDPEGRFLTIMAYYGGCPALTACVGINYFSNKDITFGGRPLGNDNAHNARALNLSAPVVSGFRGAPAVGIEPTATPTPSATPTPTQGPVFTPIAPTSCTINVANGDTSGLIAAINTANGTGTSTICLAEDGLYGFASGAYSDANGGSNALPIITNTVRVLGNGATIRRTGASEYRFFFIQSGAFLSLHEIALENGRAPGMRNGGAVYNASSGVLHLVDAELRDNTAWNYGGAVVNQGSAIVQSSIFMGNSAYRGGAIYTSGFLIVNGSVIEENAAELGSFLYYQGSAQIIQINENCIIRNSQVALYTATGSTAVNAINNWWGSSRGPTLSYQPTPDRGDLVGEHVNYEPYHLQALMNCYVPRLNSPARNAIIPISTTTLNWNSLNDLAIYDYNVQVATDKAFINGLQAFSTTETRLSLPALDDGTYYWRVRSNGLDYSEWSTARLFRVDTMPPNVPVLIAPADGATLNDPQPVLSWQPSADAVTYQVRLGNSNPPVATYSTSSTSFTPSSPLLAQDYYWQVRARNAAGNWSNWSNAFSFNLISALDDAPERYLYTTQTPTLAWMPITWAAGYHIQVDNNANFSSPVVNNNGLNGGQAVFTTPPLAEGRYYWRVRAQRANGTWSDWSSVESFWVA